MVLVGDGRERLQTPVANANWVGVVDVCTVLAELANDKSERQSPIFIVKA